MKALQQLLIILLMTATTLNAGAQEKYKTLYDFQVKSISGFNYDLSQHKGKKVMIVNTASKCGLTPQYEELEALYQKYGGENFVIIGFPANNFLGQEPGTNEEIEEFCKINYGVSFPMMAKISVQGKDKHPLYQWLTSKEENGVMNAKVKWNFQKYLIDEEGRLVDSVNPQVKPDNDRIIRWIEGIEGED